MHKLIIQWKGYFFNFPSSQFYRAANVGFYNSVFLLLTIFVRKSDFWCRDMRFCELRPPSSGYHRNGRDKHSKHNQGQLELEIRPLLTQQFHRVTANYNFHLHFWKTVTLTLKLFALHCREENRKQMDGGVRRWNYRRRDGQCLASFPAITLSPDVTPTKSLSKLHLCQPPTTITAAGHPQSFLPRPISHPF